MAPRGRGGDSFEEYEEMQKELLGDKGAAGEGKPKAIKSKKND